MEPHNHSFTSMETHVMESLISQLYAEPGFSDVDAHDLSRETGISTKSIRGTLSSLVKKGVVTLEKTETWDELKQYVIIYLNPSHWHLHPEWKKICYKNYNQH